MPKIDQFLRLMHQHKASDLHLTVGSPPILRVNGELKRVKFRELTPQDMNTIMFEILHPDKRIVFEHSFEVDFAYELAGVARFRINLFMQRKGMGAVLRTIPARILTAQELGLPEVIHRLCRLNKGLVLVTGPTGSGKSTTLAAMLDLINSTRPEHILTIEDPVEFTHPNKLGLVNQREIGDNTKSFAAALRAALREDPDVILVGEMRDLETISLGLTAAETGHLVFGTLHTSSAAKTIDRIINVFPAEEQAQIRAMLGETLRGVIAQQLLRRADGSGRVAALEILVVTPAISNLIREGKTHQIASMMQTGRKEGMVTMDQALLELIAAKVITGEDAFTKAHDKSLFVQHLKGGKPPEI